LFDRVAIILLRYAIFAAAEMLNSEPQRFIRGIILDVRIALDRGRGARQPFRHFGLGRIRQETATKRKRTGGAHGDSGNTTQHPQGNHRHTHSAQHSHHTPNAYTQARYWNALSSLMTTGSKITINTTGMINKPSGSSIFTDSLLACSSARKSRLSRIS